MVNLIVFAQLLSNVSLSLEKLLRKKITSLKYHVEATYKSIYYYIIYLIINQIRTNPIFTSLKI